MVAQLFLGDNLEVLIEERVQALGASDVDADGRGRAKASEPPGDNMIYVTSDAATVAPEILGHVDVVVACGDTGRLAIEKFAEMLPTRLPAGALRAPAEGEALVWFHRMEQSPCRVTFTPGVTCKRAIHNDVGRLLRRA